MKRNATLGAGVAVATVGLAALALPFAAGANAAPQHTPVGICHATSSDTNPYVWIVVDKDSVKYRGHLMHKTEPNKQWKSDGTWNGTAHVDGDAKGDFIQGLDSGVTEAWCLAAPVVPTDEPTTPVVDPTDPTVDPTDPVVDPTNPVVDPTNPVVDPTSPVVDPSTPDTTEVKSEVKTTTKKPTASVKAATKPQTIPSTGGSQAELAHTGAGTSILLGLGAGLLATGAVFLVAGRKPELV